MAWIGSLIVPARAREVELIKVPLTADRWHFSERDVPSVKPEVQFLAQEGFPQGIMVVKAGSMAGRQESQSTLANSCT